MSRRNALIAQSGGPSPAINASLQGALEACLESGEFAHVYAARRGIEGVLLEELFDLGCQPAAEIQRLRMTPSAAAGSCRYKLGEDCERDYQRILEVFRAHEIGAFFYIGGNDSMDTADKIDRLARDVGLDLKVMGIPKTIDNDLGDESGSIIDHTPGYGSCARYWANLIQSVNEENRAMCTSECVCVLQAMGRNTGFITAAARLGDPHRDMPLQLYLPEAGMTPERLCDSVNEGLKRHGRVIAVVAESFMTDTESQRVDGFGHVEYGASRTTAAQMVVNLLNSRKLSARGQATGQVPGVLQRCAAIEASDTDREEAYLLGAKAVTYALSGLSGRMSTLLRVSDEPYRVRYDHVPLRQVANAVRHVPRDWISPSGTDVTDAFLRYARPLIGTPVAHHETEGVHFRFARLDDTCLPKRLPAYTPCHF